MRNIIYALTMAMMAISSEALACNAVIKSGLSAVYQDPAIGWSKNTADAMADIACSQVTQIVDGATSTDDAISSATVEVYKYLFLKSDVLSDLSKNLRIVCGKFGCAAKALYGAYTASDKMDYKRWLIDGYITAAYVNNTMKYDVMASRSKKGRFTKGGKVIKSCISMICN
jgi:hypothetical protein